MSELMNARNSSHEFRWQLLTTVSALALLGAVYGSSESKAADDDADRPTIWIELGGQMEHVSGQGEAFAPGFLAANSSSSVLQSTTPVQAQNPPNFSFGEEGKITFQPEDSNWVFSASARFGRSSNAPHVHHQTYETFFDKYYGGLGGLHTNEEVRGIDKFADTHASRRESHAVLDFSVGKDVGLGMFGRNSSSTFSFGVRFAQFSSKATFDVRARPEIHFYNKSFPGFHYIYLHLPYFHTYDATGQASRRFHGIGPSLSWNASAPIVGSPQNGEITFDWGANAALLFGRQKVRTQHQQSAHYVLPHWVFYGSYHTAYPAIPHIRTAARNVTVPNVGGFAGATYRVEDFKFSAGYRADFFFGAIDGGIDAPKRTTTGFYGPFASVSVGLGG